MVRGYKLIISSSGASPREWESEILKDSRRAFPGRRILWVVQILGRCGGVMVLASGIWSKLQGMSVLKWSKG